MKLLALFLGTLISISVLAQEVEYLPTTTYIDQGRTSLLCGPIHMDPIIKVAVTTCVRIETPDSDFTMDCIVVSPTKGHRLCPTES